MSLCARCLWATVRSSVMNCRTDSATSDSALCIVMWTPSSALQQMTVFSEENWHNHYFCLHTGKSFCISLWVLFLVNLEKPSISTTHTDPECVHQRRQWFVFDHELVLPEYIVFFEYITAVICAFVLFFDNLITLLCAGLVDYTKLKVLLN